MEEILYLEADEEITSVVDKLKGLEAPAIGLVVPKGSAIAQSLVSLRLIKKEAEKLDKDISIITSDEVGKNLAAQAGLPVYADVKSRTPIDTGDFDKSPENEPIEIDMSRAEPVEGTSKLPSEDLPKDFTVHRYDEEEKDEEEEPAEPAEPEERTEHKLPGEDEFVSRHIPEAVEKPKSADEIEAERPIREPQHIEPKKQAKIKRRSIIIFIASLVGFIVLFAFFDLAVARLTIKIAMPADEIQKDADVVVEKDRKVSDLEQGIIPGVQATKDKTVEKIFTSTGEKEAGEKAKGTLTFKNDAGVDDTVAAGTTVTSTSNVEFTLDADIALPKAVLNSAGDKVLGTATGAVTAKNPGVGGNLGANTNYVVSGKSKITATGATTGGVTKKLKVVSKNDIDKAKEELKSQGETELFKELAESKTDIYLEGAGLVELDKFEANKDTGDEAEQFSAKATVKYTTISFKGQDFRDAVMKAVEKTLPADKSLLASGADTINPKVKEGDINVGKITVTGSLTSHIGQKTDVSYLSKSFRLRRLKTIKEKLSAIQNVTVENIDLEPSFALPVGPILTRNIKINIDYTKK